MNLEKTMKKLLKSYKAKGVYFDIKGTITRLPDNRFRLNVKFVSKTKVSDIKKHANDVRLDLKLEVLEVVEDSAAVYIVIAKKRPRDRHHLFHILRSQEYAAARKNMGLAWAVGVDSSGHPAIMDLTDSGNPQTLVSGTTGSGKTVALKCFLTTIALFYSPQKVNLLVADRANELAQFAALPHLACPLIEDFDRLLGALLVLRDEMERRIRLKNTADFSQLPIIVCVIDEFNSFMADAQEKADIRLVVEALSGILRMGRHTRIHLVLAAHNPTKDNMKIDTSDLPVKMAFRVSNFHNSRTALGGEGGAEKLRGQGDMIFRKNGESQHLQGAFIAQTEIENILNRLSRSLQPRVQFTITDADLQGKASEIQRAKLPFSSGIYGHQGVENAGDRLFAGVVVWALSQNEISCNQISEKFGVGWRRANGFITRLHKSGIVGTLDAKLPRKVILHSVEELPKDIAELISR